MQTLDATGLASLAVPHSCARGPARSRIALAGALLSLMTTIACAGSIGVLPPPVTSDLERKTWHELRSPDFVISSDASGETIEAFALDLARFIAVTERLVRGEPPRTPAHIYLLGPESAAFFVRSKWVAGVVFRALGGFDGFVLARDYDPIRRHVFLHEFSHYLNLRDTRIDYPTWYVEGFAEFLGSIRTRDDMMEVGSLPAWRLYELDRYLSNDGPIDLREIFGFDRGVDRRLPDAFYAISWATVHYLNSGAENRKRLQSMVSLQGSGKSWEAAYAASFSLPIEDLSARVQNHVSTLIKGVSGTLGFLPLDELDVRTNWTTREVPTKEMMRQLGEVAARGHVVGTDGYGARLAVGLLEAALEHDPTDSRAHAALAMVYSKDGDFSDAVEHLDRFEADPEPTAEALVYAGNTTLYMEREARGDDEKRERQTLRDEAIGLFERAIAMQPNNPLALDGLGRSQLVSGQLDRARESLARAQQHGEWDAALTLNRGRVERAAGNPERARRFWNEVVRLGSEEEAELASELIDALPGDP